MTSQRPDRSTKMPHPPAPREAASKTSLHRPSPSPPVVPLSEREALTFLQRELIPELQRSHHEDAARGALTAVRLGSLDPLHSLSASQKHALLGSLEARISRRRGAGRRGASAVVRLISSLELTPPELLDLERRRPVLPPR